jgi:hypothetical protein
MEIDLNDNYNAKEENILKLEKIIKSKITELETLKNEKKKLDSIKKDLCIKKK